VVELLELTRSSVDQIIKQHPKVERAMRNLYKARVLQNLLRVNPLFSSLSGDERAHFARLFKFKSVDKGGVIVREGAEPDGFYVIEHGTARVVQGGKPIAVLKAGDFFGEYSMITGSPRTASIVAIDKTDLALLDQAGFRDLLQGRPQVIETLKKIAKERLAKQPKAAG
jgi:CRP-like cAMP-binding protein